MELIAVAAGELDAWPGPVPAGRADDLDTLRRVSQQDPARQLRLRPYGDDDPVA